MKIACQRSCKGFTLIEVAAVLMIVGLMAALLLQAGETKKDTACVEQTRSQLVSVAHAIDRYVRSQGEYPRPASRTIPPSDPKAGREVALSDISVDIDTIPNGGNSVYAGALPYATLGLAESFAADCWGNKLSYFVTANLTVAGAASGVADGVLELRSGTPTAPTTTVPNAAYVVISHGENGRGAVKKHYSGGAHGWCDAGTETDSHNCDGKSSGGDAVLYDAIFNDGDPTAPGFFDDLLVFAVKKVSNCNDATYNVTWSVGMDICAASVAGQMVHQQTVVANSTSPTGTAQFKCENGALNIDNSAPYSCNATCAAGGGGGGVCGAPCSAQLLSWGTGCSATFAGISSGYNSPSTPNTASGYTGAATASCIGGSWTPPAGTCSP